MASLAEDAHIPICIEGPLLTMSLTDPCIGDYITVLIGIVNKTYTDAIWAAHARRLGKLFGMTRPECVKEIKVGSRTDNNLMEQMTSAVQLVNHVLLVWELNQLN